MTFDSPRVEIGRDTHDHPGELEILAELHSAHEGGAGAAGIIKRSDYRHMVRRQLEGAARATLISCATDIHAAVEAIPGFVALGMR